MHRICLAALLFWASIAAPAAAAPEPFTGPAEWEAAWTQVLRRHVDAKGRIDFDGLAGDPAGLDRVVAYIATVSPTSTPELFPTPADKLAFYLNAYNALAMHGVRDGAVRYKFGFLNRGRFFTIRTFQIGGRFMTLSELENDVVRKIGDPRVHFALNCMSVSCPRLPQTAFTGRDLDRVLDAAAREFMAEERNVMIDDMRRIVRVSAIFEFYTPDFLTDSPRLLDYVNRYRAQPVPADFRVEYLDYDWRVNDPRRWAKGGE